MSIIDHAEKYLGKIDQGWKDRGSGESLQIASFKDCPSETVTTFLSLGMSNHILSLSDTKKLRQEVVFSVYSLAIESASDSNVIVSFLLSVCEAIISRHTAVRRGEVISLPNKMAQKVGFDAVYCTIPIFFDDKFSAYEETSPPTIIVWILPIFQSEVDYINTDGWENFEELLEEKDPDLCSLSRDPVI